MNVFGMEPHQVDQWSEYTDTKQQLQVARDNYDNALKGDRDALDELVRWARANACLDALYDG